MQRGKTWILIKCFGFLFKNNLIQSLNTIKSNLNQQIKEIDDIIKNFDK